MDLTVLCVTRAEPFAWPFLARLDWLAADLRAEFLIAADGETAHDLVCSHRWRNAQIRRVNSRGYIEDVLDEAVEKCRGEYVLRVDDDESCSPAMVRWMSKGGYFTANHWRFQRAHLWPDTTHYLNSAPLWPDWQTRLSVKPMAAGRNSIRARSPYGDGVWGPGAILHHKFLVRTVEERRAQVHHYDAIEPGAGSGYLVYFVPEEVLPSALLTHSHDLVKAEAA